MTDIQRIANEAETVDAVLDVLEKALVTLAELANQWTKLTEFFVLVEDHIENLGNLLCLLPFSGLNCNEH